MGLFGACSTVMGRPSQSMSNLAWTVIAVLLADPDMSRSYGFALSSAAVFGILSLARTMSSWLSQHVSGWFAQVISVGLAAQMFTLPIQVVIQPQLPLLSLPANLLVAPVVVWSTITGLVSLFLAPLNQNLSYVFAWLSSCGTSVMEKTAQWLGSEPSFVLPWLPGLSGIMLVVLVEATAVAILLMAVRLHNNLCNNEMNRMAQGRVYRPVMKDRLGQWWRDTVRVFSHQSQ